MTTYVVGGCSNWRDYSFCAPLASLLWREVVGYTPFWYLIGTQEDWNKPARNAAVMKTLSEWDIQHVRVDSLPQYEVSTQAQNIRHHAACDLGWKDDDWLMMTDADIFPLKRDFYHQHESSSAKAVSYYSNGNNFIGKENVLSIAERRGEYQDLPTCHLAMRAATWREVFGNEGMTPRDSMKRVLDAWLLPRQEGKAPSAAGWQAWMSDQRIATEKLCRMDWFPDKALLIERKGQPPIDRLDRGHPSDWLNLNLDRWTDSHTLRPADQEPNWSKVRPIFANLLPQWIDRIDAYRTEFVNGY